MHRGVWALLGVAIAVRLLVDRYRGKKLNSPSDLEEDRGAVCRIEKDGNLSWVIEDVQVPNGILITPDDRTLCVADNNPVKGGNRIPTGESRSAVRTARAGWLRYPPP